ncbi:MAG: zinc ribbon domain-containing protein YjdM [Patescibacteria group bacterium]
MAHFVCKGGCKGVSEVAGFCEAEGCASQWQMLEECSCADGKHFAEGNDADAVAVAKDSNGNVLQDGDSVALIKDLTLRGSSTTFKRGTKVTNIKLTGNSEEVDCKLDGSAIVLKTCFLKKI